MDMNIEFGELNHEFNIPHNDNLDGNLVGDEDNDIEVEEKETININLIKFKCFVTGCVVGLLLGVSLIAGGGI